MKKSIIIILIMIIILSNNYCKICCDNCEEEIDQTSEENQGYINNNNNINIETNYYKDLIERYNAGLINDINEMKIITEYNYIMNRLGELSISINNIDIPALYSLLKKIPARIFNDNIYILDTYNIVYIDGNQLMYLRSNIN